MDISLELRTVVRYLVLTNMTWLTNMVLHDPGVVTSVDGVGEPAQAELQVSLGGFYVPGATNVHRLPPVTVQ